MKTPTSCPSAPKLPTRAPRRTSSLAWLAAVSGALAAGALAACGPEPTFTNQGVRPVDDEVLNELADNDPSMGGAGGTSSQVDEDPNEPGAGGSEAGPNVSQETPLDDGETEAGDSNEGTQDTDPVELPSTEPTVSGPVDVTVTLDVAERFQTLVGFGASQVFYVDWITLNPNKDELYDVLFRNLGLDVLRVGNWYQARDMQDQQIQNTIEVVGRAEQSLGKRPTVVMSSWSPPAELKSNNDVANGGTLAQGGGGYVYGAFGDWWRETIEAYTAAGVTVDYASIQNEPDFTAGYESARFSAGEGQFASYGQALSAVASSLSSLTNPPQLFGPEVIGLNVNNIQNYVNDCDPNDLDVVAHHLYNGGNPDQPDSYLNGMQGMSDVANGKPIFMSEFAPEAMGSGPQFFETAWLMHNALTAESVSAYLYWALGWRDREQGQPVDPGLVTLEDPRPEAPPFQTEKGYTINPTYYSVKHFSRWLDGGYQRIGATSDLGELRASAYVSPDESQITVVLLNTGNEAHTVSIDPQSFAVGSTSAFRTTGALAEIEQTSALGSLEAENSVTLQARSVVTVVLEGPTAQ